MYATPAIIAAHTIIATIMATAPLAIEGLPLIIIAAPIPTGTKMSISGAILSCPILVSHSDATQNAYSVSDPQSFPCLQTLPCPADLGG
jgi:hypothetical protein